MKRSTCSGVLIGAVYCTGKTWKIKGSSIAVTPSW